MGIVEQELDESMLWIELLADSGIIRKELLDPLHTEAEELLKITVTAIRKTKSKA